MLNRAFSHKGWPLVALLISAAMLCGAWAFQYIGGLAPCQMCYWQRHAHKAVVAASVLAIISGAVSASVKLQRFMLGLIALAFFVSFGMAFWHMGVEYGWFEPLPTCLATPQPKGGFSAGSILDELDKPMKTPSCEDVAWSMLGISMAGWNAIVSLLAGLISLRVMFKSGRNV